MTPWIPPGYPPRSTHELFRRTEEKMTEPKTTTRKPRHLPDPIFVSRTVEQWGGTLVECRDLWDGYSLDDAVLGGTPLKKCQWATLFAYMHRRFGPPHIGGDDYKDLSASWMLTTPDCEVFVRVNPSLSGPGFSFSPYLLMPRDAPNRAHRASELNLPADRVPPSGRRTGQRFSISCALFASATTTSTRWGNSEIALSIRLSWNATTTRAMPSSCDSILPAVTPCHWAFSEAMSGRSCAP